MRAFFTSRDPLQWVVVGAILCLLIGAVLPPLVQNRARPLPIDVQMEVNSTQDDARMLDVLNFVAGESPAREGLPECQVSPAPLRCYQLETTARLQRISNTSLGEEDSLANLDSIMRVYIDNNVVAEVNEHSLLNRESAYPAPGAHNDQTVVVADLGTGVSVENFEREGLRFFFPSATEQRSYPYYDPMTTRADPIDFDRTEKVGTVPAYVFHQKVAGINLVDSVDVTLKQASGSEAPKLQQSPEGLRTTAPANIFYSDAELDEFGYRPDELVTVDPWYSVERTIWVEPTTGIVLNLQENIYTYFAANEEQALTMAERPWSDERTLIAANFTWDDASRNDVLTRAERAVSLNKTMGILGWFGKGIAVVLLATAGLMMVRRRNDATDNLTAEDAADAAELAAPTNTDR